MVSGVVTQITSSIQTGLTVLVITTGLGVFAGLLYPSHQHSNPEHLETAKI